MIHRDDIPMDVMADIERAIRERHPEFKDFKIQCIGDAPEGTVPPDVVAAFDAVQEQFDRSFMLGACIDCDARMPGYPSPGDIESVLDDDWRPAEGWSAFSQMGEDGSFAGWQCPDCDAKGEE